MIKYHSIQNNREILCAVIADREWVANKVNSFLAKSINSAS
jgi:hypothetical protein